MTRMQGGARERLNHSPLYRFPGSLLIDINQIKLERRRLMVADNCIF